MRKSAFLLTILLMIAILLTACGKDPDILCGNCAATVPGDSFFCPNCGTAFFRDNTSVTTTETTGKLASTEDSSSAETDKSTTQTPVENTHVHSFSPATCLKPQTCDCGAINGGPAEHTYQDYVCRHCSAVDTTHAYEYLCVWILTYGTRQNDLYRIDVVDGEDLFSLVYDTTLEYAYIRHASSYDGVSLFTCLWLNNYAYGSTVKEATLKGYLNPSTFTKASSLTVSSYTGDEQQKAQFTEYARASVCSGLNWLDFYLNDNGTGIALADLGFTAY